MDTARPHCPLGLRFDQWFMEVDRAKRLENQRRLRELVRHRSSEVRVFCAHDPVEMEMLSARAVPVPAPFPTPSPAPVAG